MTIPGRILRCFKAKKALEIAVRSGGELVQRCLPQAGQKAAGVYHESRFVPFAAMWNRRQIRTVGFNQDALDRHTPGDVRNGTGLGKGDNSRKRDMESELDRKIGQGVARGKAMKDAAFVADFPQNRLRILIRLASVNDGG